MEKKLGMSAINATLSMDSYKTNVLTWRLFLASSMKAAILLGPDFLMNSDICKDTKFDNIENVFNITQKFINRTFRRNSECGMPGIFISLMDEISIVSWSSDQVGEGKSMCLRWFRSLRRTRTKMQLDSTENRLNSSGHISQDFRHYLFFARSRTTWRQRTSSQKLQGPNNLHVND